MEFIKRFHKAQRTVSTEPVPSLTLIFDNELPELPSQPLDTLLIRARQFYTEEAKEIAHSLHSVLPGGVFDQLLAEMLQLKASHFRVPFGEVRDPERCDACKASLAHIAGNGALATLCPVCDRVHYDELMEDLI